MDFKVRIKCESCKCASELRPENFKERENYVCPNCGRMLDHEVFGHLQAGIIELSKVPDFIPEKRDVFSLVRTETEPYPFNLTVKEYNVFSHPDQS